MLKSKENYSSNSLQFGVRGKPHPLLIPSIAFKILQYSSYSELKELRCVCTEWEYEASLLLQSKTHIRFPTEVAIERYMKKLPIVNYSCVSFEFGNEIFLKSQAMQKFFINHGSEVKRLKLHSPSWSNRELWEVISEMLPNLQELSLRIFIPKYGHLFPDPEKKNILPNIKKLNLTFCIEKPDRYFTNPIILKELFLALPNLEDLSCPSWPTIILPSTSVSSLVFNVILSEPEIKFKNLYYLRITANLSNNQLCALINKQFPLRELHLELSQSIRGMYFSLLLMSLDETLETLSLTFPYWYGYDFSQFDCFPKLFKLKLLCLHKFQGSLESIVKNCVELKRLVLNDVILEEVTWGDIDNKYIENFDSDHLLEELNIESKIDSPIGHISVLTKLFPNLKRFSMLNVNDVVLHTVFKKLTHLEEFTAQGDFTDSGITGFTPETCRTLMHEEDETFSPEEADQLRTYYYVGSLQKLKRLILDSNLITNLSMVYGVRQCKNLEFKRITSCNAFFN